MNQFSIYRPAPGVRVYVLRDLHRLTVGFGVGSRLSRAVTVPRLHTVLQGAYRAVWRASMTVRPWPVWYLVDSTDCDLAQSVTRHRAACGWLYLRDVESILDNAEGPVFIRRISRADWHAFRPMHRDRMLEAFENGRAHAPTVGPLL